MCDFNIGNYISPHPDEIPGSHDFMLAAHFFAVALVVLDSACQSSMVIAIEPAPAATIAAANITKLPQ